MFFGGAIPLVRQLQLYRRVDRAGAHLLDRRHPDDVAGGFTGMAAVRVPRLQRVTASTSLGRPSDHGVEQSRGDVERDIELGAGWHVRAQRTQ